MANTKRTSKYRTGKSLAYIEKIEMSMIQTLRDYYRENFRNGNSNDSFLLWIQTFLDSEKVK